MKKIYLSLILCLLAVASYALNGPCTPGSIGTGFSGTTSYCIGATATPITYNYAECSVGTGSPTGVACMATWYYNTTNTNVISGSTVTVSGPISFTSEAGINGNLPSFTPSTSTSGVRYYFCVVTWAATGTCASPFKTLPVTVAINALPGATSGVSSICQGATTVYTNATSGGTAWTSSNPAVATVGSINGVVTGISSGTALISYTVSTGCSVTKTISVNPIPAVITGGLAICSGATSTLSSDAGGTWTSSTATVATVGSASGIVTGAAAGTSIITYSLATGCRRLAVTTVTAVAAISGANVNVCEGSTISFTDATPGGTWMSSNAAVGSVSGTGVVTGLVAGNTNIIYTAPSGCTASKAITVNATPSASTGTLSLCPATTTTLSNGTPSGTWSSTNNAIATVGTGGVVSGVASGTVNISYTLATGCKTGSVVTVSALPAVITGTLNACEGLGSTALNATGGGAWSSSSPSNGTVNSSTGAVAAILAGTTTLTYTTPSTGCYRTATYTVKPNPSAITGTLSLCPGTTATVSDATGVGQSWSSNTPGVATINNAGILSGVSAGNTTITYTITTGCYTTAIVTVNPAPATFTGTMNTCIGSTSDLDNSDAGGTWTSSNTARATIGSADGLVTGIASGTTIITYTLPTGCYRVGVFTVNALPAAIGGASTVCTGTTTTLTDATAGGTWSSSNLTNATVGSASGVVTGGSAGAVNITYTVSTGCTAVKAMTVIGLPAANTGTATVCVGATTTLSNATSGGTWSSSNAAIATVGSGTGIVTGVASGNANITYSIGVGCTAVTNVTVSPLPATITGGNNVCEGSTITLASATGGGTWASSDDGTATVGSATGVVTGLATGNVNMTYTIGIGCYRIQNVAINPVPAAIGGTAVVCPGGTTTLTNATAGGTWTTSNISVANVGLTTGVVTGVYTGGATATIFYKIGGNCSASIIVTVNPAPPAITGNASVCVSLTTTLANSDAGGTWASGATGIATIDASTGVVTGQGGGNATITYTSPTTGCTTTRIVTVVTTPAAITGTASMCAGFTTTLADASIGGAWTSSDGATATVGTSGVVTGVIPGNATITYSLGGTCFSTREVTVNGTTAITGTAIVCAGQTTALGHATPGGTWSSGNTSVATVGTSGVVTGIGAGNATITYSPASGCKASVVVTVNGLPATITGTTNACVNATSTLADASTPGTWNSSATGIATVNASTGLVTGIAAGTATITFTNTASGCYRTTTFTVKALPAAIGGTMAICVGSSALLTDATSGGLSWTSSDPSKATIVNTGAYTGVAAGTSMMTYTLTSGCYNTATVTVNAIPGTITGTKTVCTGATTTLNCTPGGGTWTSTTTGIATVGSASGVVTGVSAGTTFVTYTTGASCRAVTVVTVNTVAAISGASAMCAGTAVAFTDATAGGVWSDDGSGYATVDDPSGIVTAVSAGTSNIYYTSANGCVATKAVTVSAIPGSFSNPALNEVCPGTSVTVSASPASGTWTSSNTAIATVGSASGVVTGVTDGQVTLTYTIAGGCFATTTATVNPAPDAITGSASVCVGATNTLATTSTGGVWSSINSSVASVDGIGEVLGSSPDTTSILYTLPTGCVASVNVTVNPNPGAIAGTLTVCENGTTVLSNGTPGGISWTSHDASVATIGMFSGVVTGVAAGTTEMTYTVFTGCYSTAIVTVNPVPSPIGGATDVCVGLTTTLTSSPSSNTWSSSTPSVATVGAATGVVTGVASGTSTIAYTIVATGCSASVVITVNPLPAAISGATTICVGSTTTLSTASTGGTWTSGSANATVNGVSGVVTGANAGTAAITYTLPTGCITTTTVTVLAAPAAITGTRSACAGQTTQLANATAGGTWSSSATAKATVGSATGLVVGVAGGTSTISYSLGAGCTSVAEVTINAAPATITGTMSVCVGSTQILSSADAGGTWTSSVTARATIGSSTGVVTGVASGVSVITYTLPTGCFTTTSVTVNAIAAITGVASACVGTTTSLADAAPGGTWSSSNTAVGTVGTSGVVTGISAGNTTISYIIGSTGCAATRQVTVNEFPSSVTPTAICNSFTTTLTNTATGGVWTSGNQVVATVGSASGLVTGQSAGVANITYTIGSGTACRVFSTVTVNALPANIGGTPNACVGATSTLTNATGTGTWSSSNATLADVGSASGIVTAMSAGVVSISYVLNTGCYRLVSFTSKANPSANTGTASVCVGATTSFTNATSGGVSWTSSDATTATISGGGVVTGVAAGNANITYTLSTGCYATTQITVNAIPATFSGGAVCAGLTTTLTTTPASGTWTSNTPGVASINSSTGVVTGVTSGTSFITYTLATGCRRVGVTTVNTVSAISGVSTLCQSGTSTMTNATTGGTWSSASGAVATIGTSSGLLTGVGAGNTTISYTSAAGCVATKTITINALPSAIGGGAPAVCVGLSSPAFTSSPAGGTWTTSNASIATIGTNGVVTGAASAGGSATVAYTLATGCQVTTTISVNPLPAGITGTVNACIGNSSTLSDATPGGTWASSNTAVGTVNSSTGVVTGLTQGNTTITYALTATGCIKTTNFTVNPPPAAISGASAVCEGLTIPVTDATPGGQAWTSSTPSVATVGSVSGIVTGVLAGVTTITYQLTTGCIATKSITVNAVPAAIAGGTATICEGSSTAAFTNATGGGTWVSGNLTIATVGSTSGIATGVSGGGVFISYVLTSTGCATRTVVSVNPNAPTTGTAEFCEGMISTLTNLTAGGVWSSTDMTKATVDASGNVTGVAAGNSTISYFHSGTGCLRTTVVTINTTPAAITAAGSATVVCQGSTLDLDDATAGGTWSSSATGIATIGSATASGLITGVSGGAVTLSYILSTGCYATYAVTVNPNAPITGALSVCTGSTTDLDNATAGGAWTSSNAAKGTVDASSGVVEGIAAGTTNITYTQAGGTGCFRSVEVTVNATPGGYGIIDGGSGNPLGMNNSEIGVNYEIFIDGISEEIAAGTGSSFFFSTVSPGTTHSVEVVASNATAPACAVSTGVQILGRPAGAAVTATVMSDVAIYPNPNSGVFTVKGTFGAATDKEVALEVTNILGQVVYANTVTAAKGVVDAQVSLNNAMANGMYILTVRSGNDKQIFHFVVKQ